MNIAKLLFYLGLSSIKGFMTSFVLTVSFFIEYFFFYKYVDIRLAEAILPILNMVQQHWEWFLISMWIFNSIVNFQEIKQESKK